MHFLRLIRPVNLIIIAFTMYSTRLFLYIYEQLFKINLFQKGGEEFDFFLICPAQMILKYQQPCSAVESPRAQATF